MPNPEGQVELKDSLGSTIQYSGTVGTAPVSIPTVAGKLIAQFMVIAGPIETKSLYVSLDGGTQWIPIGQTGHFAWSPKGLKQIKIKGSQASVEYHAVVNYEADIGV